jgi:hypothetical protein
MVKLMENDQEIGMSSCRLEQPDGTLDHAAKRSFPTPLSSLSHFLGLGPTLGGRFAGYQAPELGEYDVGDVDAVNGAYMLVRRTAMDQVGLLDQGYWLYMEDLDWCFRFNRAGWKVIYDGRVSTMHLKGGTSKNKKHRGFKHNAAFHRSMGRFYRKFYAGRHPTADVVIYLAILGKLAISATRSAVARRSIT